MSSIFNSAEALIGKSMLEDEYAILKDAHQIMVNADLPASFIDALERQTVARLKTIKDPDARTRLAKDFSAAASRVNVMDLPADFSTPNGYQRPFDFAGFFQRVDDGSDDSQAWRIRVVDLLQALRAGGRL